MAIRAARRITVMALGALALGALAAGCGAQGQVATPVPPTSGPPQALEIVAVNVAFEPTVLTARTGAPIVLTMDNQDQGIPHNLLIMSGGQQVTKSDLVTGPGTASVEIVGAPAGTLVVTCEIHPNMQATLQVTAP